jgi:hypothetical protein
MSEKKSTPAVVEENPVTSKPRREVVVSAETAKALLTDHTNAERLLDS